MMVDYLAVDSVASSVVMTAVKMVAPMVDDLAACLADQLDNLLAVMMVDYLVVHLAALMVVMSVVLMDVQ